MSNKFKITEELLSIMSTIGNTFQWAIEVDWDEKKEAPKEITLLARHGHARDIIFRFNEISLDGYGEAEIFIRSRSDGKEESMNEFIQFSDPDEFNDAVKRIYERGPSGLNWWEHRFGKAGTNCWYDDVLNIL